jgi:hypothetical protein
MDVSSTSMNVASVTVIAITQGLTLPSGIRSFDRILFFMLELLSPQLSSLTTQNYLPVLRAISQ